MGTGSGVVVEPVHATDIASNAAASATPWWNRKPVLGTGRVKGSWNLIKCSVNFKSITILITQVSIRQMFQANIGPLACKNPTLDRNLGRGYIVAIYWDRSVAGRATLGA